MSSSTWEPEDNLDNVENYHKPKLDNKGNMDRFLIMDFET